jgi:hypothetical protein
MCTLYGRIDLSTPKARKRITWFKFEWKGVKVSTIPLILDSTIFLPDGRLEARSGDYLVRGPKRGQYQIVNGGEFLKEAVWIDEFSSI